MGKVIKQYRYYGEKSELNFPSDRTTLQGLVTGTTFFQANDEYISILSIGIQTVPGVKFRINEPTSGNMSKEGIVVGNTGIFELNLSDGYEITNLRFDRESLKLIGNSSSNTYLIIDVVYNTEG